MKKQHFQTILKAGTAILVCSMVLAGCGTKNQKNATANITTAGNTALEQPMRLETLKDDGTDYQAYWGTKIQCITRGEHGYYYLTPEEPLYLMYWDDDTQESIKLCAKADCNHDNAACNAYFGQGLTIKLLILLLYKRACEKHFVFHTPFIMLSPMK